MRVDIIRRYHPKMKTKHRKTLAAVYHHPTASGIVFADIEDKKYQVEDVRAWLDERGIRP